MRKPGRAAVLTPLLAALAGLGMTPNASDRRLHLMRGRGADRLELRVTPRG